MAIIATSPKESKKYGHLSKIYTKKEKPKKQNSSSENQVEKKPITSIIQKVPKSEMLQLAGLYLLVLAISAGGYLAARFW